MVLSDGFPGASGTADSTEVRKALAGLIVRDKSGNALAGLFSRQNAAQLVTAVAGTWTVSTAAFEGCSVRGGGPVFMANDGAVTSPANTAQAPGANSRIDTLYFKQNENSAPYADGNNSPIFGWVYGTASATPVANAAGLAAIPGAVPLADVLIPSTATSMSSAGVTITSRHPFTALSGTPIPVRNAAELTALGTNWAQGTKVFQIDQGITWMWFDLYNATTNPTGRKTAGWKPWETAVPVSYYSGSNYSGYNPASDVPLMTWTARAGRVIVEFRSTLITGGGFTGSFIINHPFAASDKYLTGTWVMQSQGAYKTSSATYLLVALANSTTSVTVAVQGVGGTYATVPSALNATVPEAQAAGNTVAITWEYDPA